MPEPEPTPGATPPIPLPIKVWFAWAFTLLAVTGLFLPRIIEFTDFSEKAPFSILGIFMMAELAAVLFGVTVAMQRKKIGFRFALGIAALPAPILGGLPPLLLDFPPDAASGWWGVVVPVGLALSVLLVILLLRPSARAYFSED